MTVRTRTPDTTTHTREMLESILRPHSLEELHALVGSFPFKAVKVVEGQKKSDVTRFLPVGDVVALVGKSSIHNDCFADSDNRQIINYSKQWRLAAED